MSDTLTDTAAADTAAADTAAVVEQDGARDDTQDGGATTLTGTIIAQARAETDAAATTASRRALPDLEWPRWLGQGASGAAYVDEREELLTRARATHAWSQLARLFPKWRKLQDSLTSRAIAKLADNKPVDPNDFGAWVGERAQAFAVLRRHGISRDLTHKLALSAIRALVDGQAKADEHAGIDWTVLHESFATLDEQIRVAHKQLPISFDDPQVWRYREDQRLAVARRIGLHEHQADDLSRWAIAHPDEVNEDELRTWRIGSHSWLEIADGVLPPVNSVERPIAAFVIPDFRGGDGWRLSPVLSLDMIRLIAELGGAVDRDLRDAWIPGPAGVELLERINHKTLHAGKMQTIQKAGELSEELANVFGVPVNPGLPKDKRDRWGRVLCTRSSFRAAQGDVVNGVATTVGEEVDVMRLKAVTFNGRGYTTRLLGKANSQGDPEASAAMDLGEAVEMAVERGLPLLLSTEAAGRLDGVVRVGRMKGRPGMLTITSSDGLSATTKRTPAEQAIAALRKLKREQANVTLDAGAAQVLRMTLAKPLSDDPVLFPGRQQEVAAIMVAGSTVNASQTGAGKCIAAGTRVFANGRLVSAEQLWRDFAGSPLLFDGEGFWAMPSGDLIVNSIDRWGRMVPGRVTRLYRQRVSERGRRVTLDDGSTITITNAHKLLGVDGWTLDVKPGDFVCVPGALRWGGERLDRALVELIAWQIAEGHEPALRHGSRVRIAQADRVVLERLRALAGRVEARYGLRLNAMPIEEPTGKAAVLNITSVSYRRLLEAEWAYTWGSRSANKRIPDRIVAADDQTVSVFLRAFFDAEGSVSAERGRVEITSASRELIDQLAVMLRRFGVWLRIREKVKADTNGSGTRRRYWTGYLGGESLRRFAEHVGFGVAAKAARLQACCTRPANSNVEGVPVADLVCEVRAAGAKGQLAVPADRVGATVGHDRAMRMLRGYRRAVELTHDSAARAMLDGRVRNTARTLDADTVESVADRLHHRLAREAFHARVVSVKEVQLDGWVYDLEVAEHHNFVAGGLLAHNTVQSGRALAHRCATTERFRAIVVCEGRLTVQWREELTIGAPGRGMPPLTPNAEVVILHDRSSVAAQIRQHDRRAGERALICLVPNSVLDRFYADLCVIPWHLLIADEVHRYINPSTEAHLALKHVRFTAVADCWMLSATPKGKSAESLDVLVGMAVGDEAMLSERLNTREAGDLTDAVNAHRLRMNYGPYLVRVTKKDLAGFVPKVRPADPLAVEPDEALAELLQAIRDGGRAAYARLLEVVAQLKTLQQGTDLYKEALREMSRAQATVLGNVNVFVDASVDPETLLHSKSALAQGLVEQGLVREAMTAGGGIPLLRAITARAISNAVADEQVLVFAERVWCLRNLAKALRDRHGVGAYVADGSLKREEFEDLKGRFLAGAFPVLCMSKIGQEGHNLQTASQLVHYDMPWTPTPLEQRAGRVDRPGSQHEFVSTTIPYIKGGGIEHVISILAGRGAENHQVLDSFEGVKAAESSLANQLSAITEQVAESKDEAGFKATAARLRVAGAVFGH